jgi:aldehyde:ferredoxin oxidoreductase
MMEYLSSDKIAIIDLATSEITEEELPEELVSEKIGGAGITSQLYERFKEDDPIVLGTGLLTGTLVPASALGVITAKSALTEKVSHVPLTLYAGMELKYSGFDYIVIKGSAEKPVYLWIHDGIADIHSADDLWGKDVWETTDHIRKSMGDDFIQALAIGGAGESGADHAQVCINHWASGDRLGFGNLFGKKKLKLVAIRGMGLLEIADPEGFIDRCKVVLSDVKGEGFAGKNGIAELAAEMGHGDIEDWIGPLIHKHRSCFNTPLATNSFVFLDDDPKLLKESQIEEPGYLITDVYGLLGFKKLGLSASDSCKVLRDCARYGIDGVAVAELCEKAGIKDPEEIKKSLPDLKGPVAIAGNGVFSPWAPYKALYEGFDLPTDGSQDAKWWERRQAVAYIFGIHPIFALMSPVLSEEKLLELAGIGTGLELTGETLGQVIASICG